MRICDIEAAMLDRLKCSEFVAYMIWTDNCKCLCYAKIPVCRVWHCSIKSPVFKEKFLLLSIVYFEQPIKGSGFRVPYSAHLLKLMHLFMSVIRILVSTVL